MTRIRNWLAGKSQKWLDRFKGKYELTGHPSNAVKNGGRVLLHVGCGASTIANIPLNGFQNSLWQEYRLDADASVLPDIVGTMVDMIDVEAEFADAIFSSHNIEHLYAHEVPLAIAEFRRVLKQDGFLVITCPDLQSVCAKVADGKLLEPVYESAAGPISPIDILYGYRPSMAAGNLFMAHRSGFTLNSLVNVLREGGFKTVYGFCRPEVFDLWILASKSDRSSEEMSALAKDYLIQSL